MKLEIYTDKGWLPVVNRLKYYTEYEYDGTQTLSFDISPKDDIFISVKNENLIRNDENLYIIKQIQKRKTLCSVKCQLCMDDWTEGKPYIDTKNLEAFKTKSLADVLNLVKPAEWTVQNAGIRSIKRTLELENATPYDVLMACQKTYNVVYEINVLSKTIMVLDPSVQVDTGMYITPELNMTSIEYTGDSEDFATRITALGKQNEDGSYVNFAAINNGKDYVENSTYKDKVKWIIWKDERYTIPEELLADTKKKLEKQSYPIMSYTVGVNDLAKYNADYAFLNFKLYNIAHTIIDKHTTIIQTIVKIKTYHDKPEKNEITLSAEAQKITSIVDKVATILGDDGQKITGSILADAQKKATELINAWATKGYVLMTENEIYILDKLPKETAKYCIRFNLGGIAFSQSGWAGPYISAWTIDGRFNADFITAGTIRGLRIEGNDIVGGTIKGNTTISVGTDLTVGNNINLNPGDGNATKTISLGNNASVRFSIDEKYGSSLYFNVKGANGSGSSINLYGNSIDLQTSSGGRTNRASIGNMISRFGDLWCDNFNTNGLAALTKGANVSGNLVAQNLMVTGSKSRIVETTKGFIKMNAVESTIAVFEDFGTSEINDNGECTINFDPLFMETVNTSNDYYCFLTPYDTSDAHLTISQKTQDYFIVKGSPKTKFDWRVTVKQKGYENARMEIHKEGD